MNDWNEQLGLNTNEDDTFFEEAFYVAALVGAYVVNENASSKIASKIAEAVSVIAETCRSCNAAINSASIGEVMTEIQSLDEVTTDIDLYTKCCQLMMFKPAREMFIALRGSEDKRLHWLKHAANNPFPFMNM